MCVYRLVGSRRRGATRIEINRAFPLLPFARRSPRRIVDRRTEPLPGRKFISRGPDPPNSPRFEPTNYFLVAQVSRRGCKPQPPLEIAGIRAAVPLTFELHEYLAERSSRGTVYTLARIHSLSCFLRRLLPPPSSPYRVNFRDRLALGPKLEFPKFDGSSIRDKIDQRVANRRTRGIVHFIGHLYIYSFYSLPFYLFPPSFNRRSNFLYDFLQLFETRLPKRPIETESGVAIAREEGWRSATTLARDLTITSRWTGA